MAKANTKENIIYTVGHSNIPTSQFVDLLQIFKVAVVVDVRSRPFSKYASQFNRDLIRQSLVENNIIYVYMGDLIGGKPEAEEFYDCNGYVMYDHLAESPAFQTGISRLMKGIALYRVALMCSEEDPTNCHRRLLIGKVLREQEVNVLHIRKGGIIQTEEELNTTKARLQADLFGHQVDSPWRSAVPVLTKGVTLL